MYASVPSRRSLAEHQYQQRVQPGVSESGRKSGRGNRSGGMKDSASSPTSSLQQHQQPSQQHFQPQHRHQHCQHLSSTIPSSRSSHTLGLVRRKPLPNPIVPTPTPPPPPAPTSTSDLISILDSHIAWNVDQIAARPSTSSSTSSIASFESIVTLESLGSFRSVKSKKSVGTLLVDFDGTDDARVSLSVRGRGRETRGEVGRGCRGGDDGDREDKSLGGNRYDDGKCWDQEGDVRASCMPAPLAVRRTPPRSQSQSHTHPYTSGHSQSRAQSRGQSQSRNHSHSHSRSFSESHAQIQCQSQSHVQTQAYHRSRTRHYQNGPTSLEYEIGIRINHSGLSRAQPPYRAQPHSHHRQARQHPLYRPHKHPPYHHERPSRPQNSQAKSGLVDRVGLRERERKRDKILFFIEALLDVLWCMDTSASARQSHSQSPGQER